MSAEGDPGARAAGEAKAAFHLRMRARGLRDLAVLRAFERVPRSHFADPRHGSLAERGLALPIACGQTATEPWLVATMIEALEVAAADRVLEVGSGSGYATAVLAHLAETVVGTERYLSLARAAQARISALGIDNAAVTWGDGLVPGGSAPPFDRIIVHGALGDTGPLLPSLADGGLLVFVRDVGGAQVVATLRAGGRERIETTIGAGRRLQPIVPGLVAL